MRLPQRSCLNSIFGSIHERSAGPPQASERPLGGPARSAVGAGMSAAPGRPKQANAPSGGRRAAPWGQA